MYKTLYYIFIYILLCVSYISFIYIKCMCIHTHTFLFSFVCWWRDSRMQRLLFWECFCLGMNECVMCCLREGRFSIREIGTLFLMKIYWLKPWFLSGKQVDYDTLELLVDTHLWCHDRVVLRLHRSNCHVQWECGLLYYILRERTILFLKLMYYIENTSIMSNNLNSYYQLLKILWIRTLSNQAISWGYLWEFFMGY